MKTLFKSLAVLLFAVMPVLASAQEKKLSEKLLQQFTEIVSVEHEDGTEIQVFHMPDKDQYYLQVGNLGVGTDVVQVNFDPVFILFIPLGSTLEEAIEKLAVLKEHAKAPRGAKMETQGCLCFGFPNEEELEPVTVTARRLVLTRSLEFSVTRGDWVRAAFIERSDLNALYNGVKFYRKLHPKAK